MDAGHTVLEWFVELAQPSDDKVNQAVDVGTCFFLDVYCFDILISLFFSNTKQVIDSIIKNFYHFFRNELFLG